MVGVAHGTVTVTVRATNAAGMAERTFELEVMDIPPELAEAIEPISVFVDDTAQVDLSGAFSGTALVYSAMSSSEAMATVSVDGAMLTVAGVGPGMATVTVTATNSADNASQEVMVTVMDVPPKVAEPIEPISVFVEDTTQVDLTGAFSGTSLVHSAMSSSEELATVSVDGTMLTVTGVAAGPATVTVTATNSADSASQEVMVTVMDVPPEVAEPLEPVSVRVGETAMVDLSSAFSGTALVHSAMSSSEELATVSVDGTMLTVTGVAAGPATVTVTATNSADSASQEVMVTVMDVPPEVAEPLEPVSVRVGEMAMVDLSNAFSGTALVHSAMSSSEEMATVSVDGTMLTVTGVAAGSATVTVTATNSADSASQDVMITVLHVPLQVHEPIEPISVFVDDITQVDLAGAFLGTVLEYSAMSSSEELATVSVDGTMLTVTGVAAGPATVTVTATNSAESASQEVMVTVMDVPPEVAEPLEPVSVRAGDRAMVDLSNAFSGTALVHSAMSSSEEMATVSVDGTMLTVTGVAAGSATVTVTATNSAGSASQEVMITVLHVPLQVHEPIEPISVFVDDITQVDLAGAFLGTVLEYSAMSSSEELATVSVDGTMLTVTGVTAGPATVTVTATNSAESASQEVMVTVMDVPPEVAEPLEPVSVRAGETAMVDLSNAFSGTALVHSAMSSSEEMATVSVDGTMLTVTGVAAGSATVTVTATNSAESASQDVMVMVMDVLPAVAEPVEPVSVLVGETMSVDLAAAFSGTALVYSAMSASEEMATVSVDGTMLTVTGVAHGPATVTVTATNSAESASQDVMVMVMDVLPAVAEPVEPVSVLVGEAMSVDLAGAFSGTALVYSAMSSSGEMATASVEGAMLTVTGVAHGPATVTVTATNSAASASQDVMVMVMDVPPAVAEPLEPVSVRVGETAMVDLSNAFSGTALVHSANSSSEDMVTVWVDGTTLTVTGVAAGPATVTVTATNGAASASQDLSVTVEDVPPAVAEPLADIEVRVGDSMTVELSGAFSGTALVYSAMSSSDAATVSLEGSSLTVTGMIAGPAAVTVTAMNSAASADQTFVATVRDVPPGTVGMLPDISLVAGGAPAVIDLARYFSGSALVFGATETGAAVRISLAGAELMVEPAIEGVGTVSVTASNTEGSVLVNFDATVTTDAAEVDAIERSLAAIGAATLSSVNSAFTARFRGPGAAVPVEASSLGAQGATGDYFALGGAGGSVSPLGGLGWNGADWSGSDRRRQDWGRPGWNGTSATGGWADSRPGHPAGYGGTFVDRNFVMPLSASGGSGGLGGFSLWGHADRQSFEGEGIDGDLTSVYVGTDVTVGENWLVGIAASQSEGDVDYRFAGAGASGTGSLSTDMMTIFPYVRLDVDQCTELWAVLGFGSGDVTSKRSTVFRSSDADLSMSLASFGGSRVVAAGEGWSVTLLGDAATIRLETDGSLGAIADVEVDVSRVRAGIQGARTMVMDDGARVVLFGELAARNDSGDGNTGSGAEVSAGVRYNTAGRMSFEFKGRLLANHSEDDAEESAFSISAMLRPLADGSGLSVALSSRLGERFGMSGMMPGMDYDYVRRQRRDRADQWGFDAPRRVRPVEHGPARTIDPVCHAGPELCRPPWRTHRRALRRGRTVRPVHERRAHGGKCLSLLRRRDGGPGRVARRGAVLTESPAKARRGRCRGRPCGVPFRNRARPNSGDDKRRPYNAVPNGLHELDTATVGDGLVLRQAKLGEGGSYVK